MDDLKTAVHAECHEEVSRGGMVQPCDKPAVALKHDNENGSAYPVCAYHAHGDMITLVQLLAAWNMAQESREA